MYLKLPLLLLILLISSIGFFQKPIGLVDSLENSVKDIKEEIVKIKEGYYVIVPYGLAGNVCGYVSQDCAVLVTSRISSGMYTEW